jgi:hypothetical protein
VYVGTFREPKREKTSGSVLGTVSFAVTIVKMSLPS